MTKVPEQSTERMFDTDSFLDEITNPAEAKSCYDYFSSNLTAFRRELKDEGLAYAKVEKIVGVCWKNLATSAARVGWANQHLVDMAKRYGQTASENTK